MKYDEQIKWLVLERDQQKWEGGTAFYTIHDFYETKDEAVKEIDSLLKLKKYNKIEFFIAKAEEVNPNEFYRTNKRI